MISLEPEDLKGLTAKTMHPRHAKNAKPKQTSMMAKTKETNYSCWMLIAKSHMHLISDIHRLDIPSGKLT